MWKLDATGAHALRMVSSVNYGPVVKPLKPKIFFNGEGGVTYNFFLNKEHFKEKTTSDKNCFKAECSCLYIPVFMTEMEQ